MSYVAVRLQDIANQVKNVPERSSVGIEPFPTTWDKFLLIFEEVLITFFITLIPELIALGHVPRSLQDIWISILTSVLRALYCYMRIRSIEKAKPG